MRIEEYQKLTIKPQSNSNPPQDQQTHSQITLKQYTVKKFESESARTPDETPNDKELKINCRVCNTTHPVPEYFLLGYNPANQHLQELYTLPSEEASLP